MVFLDEVGQTEKCDSDRKSKRKMYKCSDVFWAEGQTKQGFLVFTPATSARQTKKRSSKFASLSLTKEKSVITLAPDLLHLEWCLERDGPRGHEVHLLGSTYLHSGPRDLVAFASAATADAKPDAGYR